MFIISFESSTPSSRLSIQSEYYTQMQSLLRTQPGFISETPFASPHHPDRAILIAKWENEAGVHIWRKQFQHLQIQYKARHGVFAGYRLRVGPELSSSSIVSGAEDAVDEAEGEEEVTKHEGRYMVVYEGLVSMTGTADVTDLVDSGKGNVADVVKEMVDAAVYQGEKSVLWISSWRTENAAVAFQEAVTRVEGDSVIVFRVKRDYGGMDRSEAPVGADEAQAASVVEK
ncbi:MAG: hypothetical protein Q9169_006523 [Polycauliona sp. 2 TL-2023]